MNKTNKNYTKAFRWFEGKRLLAEVRSGDYAHAGEEEAIRKVFSKLSKDKHRKILDIGCGCGGTANFIQVHGWGRVTGVDIEKKSIEYARKQYPKIKFYIGDACNNKKLATLFPKEKFDVIVLFHSLCVFPEQSNAIKALSKLAHKRAKLIIFEYVDLTFQGSPLNNTKEKKTCFNVMNRKQFKSMLRGAGWQINDENIINISRDFKRWYKALLNQLEKKKRIIIGQYGQEYYERAKKRYGAILKEIEKRALGGCIIYVTRANENCKTIQAE